MPGMVLGSYCTAIVVGGFSKRPAVIRVEAEDEVGVYLEDKISSRDEYGRGQLLVMTKSHMNRHRQHFIYLQALHIIG